MFRSIVFFFFFQAEDGIRDTSVTGVQTCALPISRKNVAEVHVLAVNSSSRVVILLHDGTFERQAGEHTLRARVGQHFSVHLPVSSGGRVTANRACSN